MKYIQPITLDVARCSAYKYIYAKQGDTDSRYVKATIVSGGTTRTFSTGETAKIRALKPDGTSVFNDATIEADNTVLAELTEQMLAVTGLVHADIVIFGENGEILSTATFRIEVEAAPIGSGLTSTNEFLALVAIIEKNEALTAEYETALAQLEGIRDTTQGYATTAGQEATKAASSSTAAANQAAAATAAQRAASNSAADAAAAAGEAQGYADSIDPAFLNAKIDAKADDLYFDEATSLLYLMSDGEIIGSGIKVSTSGGGGGGTTQDYTITLLNLLESRILTVAQSADVKLKFNYSSVDAEGVDDGPGVGTITVGGVRKAAFSAKQGENEVDVTSYLAAGSNTVKIKVENSEGAAKTLSYTVTVVSIGLTTNFDTLASYSGAVEFAYTLSGTGTKTMYFVMDGIEIGTAEVKTNGRSQSFTIPEQKYGGHLFSCYGEIEIDGVMVQSNVVTLGMIWTDPNATVPAIAVTCNAVSATQGETLVFPFIVHDPTSETTAVTLSVIEADGTIYSSQTITVDRTAQNWVLQDYPEGDVKFQISCGDTSVQILGDITAYEFPLEPVTDGLELEFNAVGRSNGEDTPASWQYGAVVATFDGFGWSGADGWLNDNDGESVLRFLPGDTMNIPFTPFAVDARETGYAIEVELATRNVRDYDSVVISCMSGGRGFEIASQRTSLASEQSTVSMSFKEDSRIRVTYVVEQKNQNRLIYIFVNGVLCGATQYPTNDDFSQPNPVGLTIGADSCGLDLYRIRCYRKPLTRREQVDNYICDRPTLRDRIDAYERNNILNDSEEISIEKLPPTLPYMIISCAELPQFKGNNKTCEITYVDPANSAKSFTASGVDINVQGTSSAGYKKKNFLIKLLEGITLSSDGVTAEAYSLRSDSIPVSVFCLKADVASSDNANNVELVRLYNRACPYRHPAMEADSRVRYGIDGKPIVVFWHNTATGETTFWGKYNFNNDKSTPNVFGWGNGYECWEIKNNTSDRVTFHRSDFGDGVDDDFESVYPKDYTDYTHLKALTDWIVSTDRDAVSTAEEKAERLAKFKAEFEDYFVKDAMLFYYLFTETFLMVDNRAKNFFPVYDPNISRWYPFPYDMDTALGINNEGQLVFDYDLEDTDQVGGYNVYNAQTSVLWCNIRDAFGSDLADMYADLRNASNADGTVPYSYEAVNKEFVDHQEVWPEVAWNEDAFEKYLRPLFDENDASYLTMLQGNKASQRDWWMFNGFRYRDSKYKAGDANTHFITLRCYALGNITVVPYSHIWPRVKYGSYTVTSRGKRNVATTLVNPLDKMDDTETYIYSADRIADVGDLSPMQVGYADFTAAVKLQKLKLGDGADSFQNTKLTELYVGNNDLLSELDVQNCVGLTMTVDLSACDALETVKAKGSSVTGFNLSDGGRLKTLELPATVTNFTIQNQQYLNTVSFEGYAALSTLRVENTPNIPLEEMIINAGSLNRVRLVDVEWNAESSETLTATITKLKSCIGMDAAGKNTTTAVVTGRVNVPSITSDLLTEINEAFPQLVVVANGVPQYIVRYLDWDNTVLYRAVVSEGASAVNAVTAGYISAPTREGTEDTGYAFKDFGTLPTNIHSNVSVVAQYNITYRVRFLNEGAVYNTQWVVSGGSATKPSGTPTKASTAQYTYTFSYWSGSYTNVTAPVDVNAVYTSSVRKYTVYFYNGSTLLQTVADVPYGGSATYTGETPVDPEGNNAEFQGWSPSPTSIVGNTTCYAQFATGAPTATDASNAYGIEWDYSQTGTTLTRLGLAASFAAPAPATSLTGAGSSPFDSIMPWAGMKKYNVIDGAIAYSEDDAGFSETDYDTVVYIPEFYYTAFKDADNSKWMWAISPTEQEGYAKHPGSGRYIGRFHTSGDSSAVFSKSGVTPLASTSITNFNTYSHNKGSNWYQMDVAVWSALQLLYLVEFANFYSQDTLGTGQNTGSVKATGATTGAVYHTLKMSSASNQYRWVENPFSNLLTWLDGFYSSSRSVYLTAANTNLSTTTSGKADSGVDLPSSNGCICGFGYSSKFPWAFIPDTIDGTDYTKYVTDRVGSSSSNPIASVGGNYVSIANYGFFFLFASYAASGTSAGVGSRLLYIP